MSDPTQNTVTKEHIDSLIDNAPSQEAVFWGKELVVSYRLPNGFTITGRAACVDPANFSLNIGRTIAKDNAKEQLWQLEGYLLQEKLHNQTETSKPVAIDFQYEELENPVTTRAATGEHYTELSNAHEDIQLNSPES